MHFIFRVREGGGRATTPCSSHHASCRCLRLHMEQSGSLRSGVKTVEEAVKSVVSPVYDKFHLVPDEILRHTNTRHAEQIRPPEPPSERAMRLYTKCETKAEQCVASAWQRVRQLPMFPRVANVVVPKAMYCTERYNEAVVAAAEKGYRVSAYLPLVPKERIVKIFSENEE